MLLVLVGGFVFLMHGCSGTGFDKQAALVPDYVTVGIEQGMYNHSPEDWSGVNISATWEFKKAD